MQIINQIGHIQHWGLSPATNFLSHLKPKQEQPVRVLISGASDIRHIMKTLTDIDINKAPQPKKLQIYFHETQKELLCRALLFLHIIHQKHLNFQQRVQLFLDLYGNALIKQRNCRYLNNLRIDLLNLIHSEKKILTPIKNFVNLKMLKFQERDEMSEIMQSWNSKIEYNIQDHRDKRLRLLFKQRYDYRANLVDWDYSMLLNQNAPLVHFYHYKEWRMSGLAFEQRFSTYCQPNRTLASYVPGKKKKQHTSCLVRGYWGDIVISPYISMGIETNSQQKQLLFKKANMKYIGHSVQLTEYNLMYWLKRLETNITYQKYFRDYYRTDEQGKKKLQEKQKQKKKNKSMKDNNLKEIKQQEEEQIKQKDQTEEIEEANKKQDQELLDSDEEEKKAQVMKYNAEDIKIGDEENGVLSCFNKYGVEFYPISLPVQGFQKAKFKEFFDVIVLGFMHSAYLTKDIQNTLKPTGQMFLQKATYIIPKKKDERKQLENKLKAAGQKQGAFKVIQDNVNYFVMEKK